MSKMLFTNNPLNRLASLRSSPFSANNDKYLILHNNRALYKEKSLVYIPKNNDLGVNISELLQSSHVILVFLGVKQAIFSSTASESDTFYFAMDISDLQPTHSVFKRNPNLVESCRGFSIRV
jgi:hypothetical protein